MNLISEDYLMHHGVKGMKWGVRRYQNADGSLTNAGRRRLKKVAKNAPRTNRDKVKSEMFAEMKKNKNLQTLLNEQDKLVRKEQDIDDKAVEKMRDLNGDDFLKAEKNLSKTLEPLEKKAWANEKKINDIEKQYGQKYVNKFNDAFLKDLNYTGNTQQGRKILESINRNYIVRYDGLIMQNRVLGGDSVMDDDETRLRRYNIW